jgi:hypothetical protein
MSAWGNTDSGVNKPKFDYERQVRELIRLNSANTTVSGNTSVTLIYNDGAGNNVANIGVSAGQYVYFAAGLAGNGIPGFFASNNTVASVSGNTVILTNAAFNTTPANTVIEFDSAINWSVAPANTFFADTILVTATRAANGNNATANVGNINQGWNRIQKKVNNDGTVRFLKETLVALANASASNTSSGNTSFGQIVSGL